MPKAYLYIAFLLSLVLSSLLRPGLASAEEAKNLSPQEMVKSALAKTSTTEPLINETVTFDPIENHHFNLEAPQDCGKDASLEPTARQVSCQFHSPGKRDVVVSVCDDAKKYCKQEIFSVVVQEKKSGETRMMVPPSEKTLKMQEELKKKVMAGFQVLSPENAKTQAAGKKGVLVVFSAEWCPPCNMAKEFLFSNPNFAKVTKDLLLVYVDGDSPQTAPWRPILKANYYPTFIVLNTDLEALDVEAGYMTLATMDRWLNQGLKADLTLKDLEHSVQSRIQQTWTQRFWDLFKSEAVEKAEAEKLARVYLRRGKKEKFKNLVGALKLPSLEIKATENSYMELAFEKDLDDEKEAELQGFAKQLLAKASEEPETANFVVSTYCLREKMALKEECVEALNKIEPALEKSSREDWGLMSEGEKALAMSNLAKSFVGLRETSQGFRKKFKDDKATVPFREADIASASKACVVAHQSLKNYSPLGEKSRVARIGQMGCGDKAMARGADVKLLESLISDFPYEETFYRKLSGHYKSKKEFAKALDYNAKALKYSYGAIWLSNVVTRAEILQAMNKSKEAFEYLKANMNEVQVDTGRYAWVFEKMRSQYEDLKKEVM